IALDPDQPFDLSSGVIRSLMDGYDRLNKSIDNLISKIQFIHLAYFHTNPLCEFFFDNQQTDNLDLGKIKDVEFVVQHLRLTPSWQNSQKAQLIKSENEVLEILIESYRNRRKTRQMTLLALDLLKKISQLWPEKERTAEWVLYNIYRSELVNYAQEFCKLIKHSNDEMVMKVLVQLEDSLEWLEPTRKKLSELMANEELRRTAGRTHLANTHEPLMAGIKLCAADREFGELVDDLNKSLSDFFNEHLGPRTQLELHEAWTFDDKILLNEVFHPLYMDRIKNDFQNTRQDLEEMYGLYLETNGKLINLMDWFGAFRVVGKKRMNESEGERNFIRCIGDLGMVGVLAGCKRKKEHVTRNLW
ncbi:hypothetical protein O181_114715, partial [Austropuccinia psidii MF-1]|nr:hypothetical protein [Austropuccinia psidii MF-1]